MAVEVVVVAISKQWKRINNKQSEKKNLQKQILQLLYPQPSPVANVQRLPFQNGAIDSHSCSSYCNGCGSGSGCGSCSGSGSSGGNSSGGNSSSSTCSRSNRSSSSSSVNGNFKFIVVLKCDFYHLIIRTINIVINIYVVFDIIIIIIIISRSCSNSSNSSSSSYFSFCSGSSRGSCGGSSNYCAFKTQGLQ